MAQPVPVILYIGLIDVLQEFTLKKQLEHHYKTMNAQKSAITIQGPQFYSDRLRDFLETVFIRSRRPYP